MRVISGKYKGHRLAAFQAQNIRPTTDRIKESLFNKLMSRIPCERALDLFSGTGNLAIEALSRGVESVTSVESHAKSLQIMRKNKSALNIGDEWVMRKQDVFSFLKQYEGVSFPLVFIDPPFTQSLAHSVMEAISSSRVFSPETLFCIESSGQERIDPRYGNLSRYDVKDFGDKKLSLFRGSEES